MIRCLIVDDEPLARERLRRLVEECGLDAEVVAEAAGGEDALARIRELRPDVVFLDVQMPVLDGFDVVELMPLPRPAIVFVTAHDEHAVRAFEVHAIDYLTKPVRPARLRDALERAIARAGTRDSSIEGLVRHRAGSLRRITVNLDGRLRIVPVEKVRSFSAEEKRVIASTRDGAYEVDLTLDELEARLDGEKFSRVHRSWIVNLAAVRELIPWFAGSWQIELDDGSRLPVARRRLAAVRRAIAGR